MNSTPSRRSPMSFPLVLAWSHCGSAHRVTPWPEVQLERRYGDEWIAVAPTSDLVASAARTLTPADWQPYLEFVPAVVREFLARFTHTRMEALLVAARCPALFEELAETPALAAFVFSHPDLRGTAGPAWAEINAVHDRSGIYGLLEWLGLPASRQTLAVLRNLSDPDVPKRFLGPLRAMLWEPRTIFTLQRTPGITDRQLARYCHAPAAA
jgi:hypothetical protein